MQSFWDRPTLKRRARNVLSKTYWRTLGVMLLASILIGRYSGITLSYSVEVGELDYEFSMRELIFNFERTVRRTAAFISSIDAAILIGAGALIFLVVVSYSIFFRNPLGVGSCRYLSLNRFGAGRARTLFAPFTWPRYLSVVATMLVRDIKLFLWMLLFVVPGIVKSYSYWMVPYIIAENPGISTSRAFKISCQTTKGEKMRIFVFELSFIGWYLLCALTFGIGLIFLLPYVSASRAELYAALRYKAAKMQICTRDEIGAELF